MPEAMRPGAAGRTAGAWCARLLLLAAAAVPAHAADTANRQDQPGRSADKWAASACLGGAVDDRLAKCVSAARAGDRNAPFKLMQAYHLGWYGANKDPVEAARWSKVAADQGSGIAQAFLGRSYLCGAGVQHNEAQAKHWFERASELGRQSGLSWMGYLSETGRGTATDYAAAVKWYSRGAGMGQEESLFGLGLLYLEGRGVKADRDKAMALLRAAEEQLLFSSRMSTGLMKEMGTIAIAYNQPAPETQARLIGEMRDQAAREQPQAQVDLGLTYFDGTGVKKDQVQAAQWFERAAHHGDSMGQFYLAQSYLRGWGVAKDPSKAAELFQQAASSGSVPGSFAAGYMLVQNPSASPDADRGLQLVTKAASAGDKDAQSMLAVWYAQGAHVPQDTSLAKQWWARRMSCDHF